MGLSILEAALKSMDICTDSRIYHRLYRQFMARLECLGLLKSQI